MGNVVFAKSARGQKNFPVEKEDSKARFKKIDGRSHMWDTKARKWRPQCNVCLKHCARNSFRALDTADGKPLPNQKNTFSDTCRTCEGRARRIAGTPRPDKECPACKTTQKYTSFRHGGTQFAVCSKCRSSGIDTTKWSPLDRAYKLLYPNLVEYSKVTGTDILSDPSRYPGKTYYHLTLAERERAVRLAKHILWEETGEKKWKDDLDGVVKDPAGRSHHMAKKNMKMKKRGEVKLDDDMAA